MTERSADTWAWMQDVFERAEALPGDARADYLEEACGDHHRARRRIEAMLAAAGDEHFLGAPASGPTDALPRPRIAGYEILGRLGAGGMGVVYRAIRVVDEMRRPVAVKVLRHGMDTERIVRRFRLERSTLAGLDHPNIVAAIDGGTTQRGRPFLVMELIDGGLPIDAYCRERELDVAARVRLFEQVCAAVAHAHRHLVVHRDLKPGNILVTKAGMPKVLDFGVAKILDPDRRATVTAGGERVLTPRYAGPEQVRGGAITTATDVYALGVVLYELLVGRAPYEVDTSTPAGLERAICDVEPTRPSTACVRTGRADPDAAGRVRRSLRGDLDVIVMKALAKEPARRYAGADALAEDLRRYLAAEPIAARPPTAGYRVATFVRRHRGRLAWAGTGSVAAAILAVVLVAALVVMPRNAARAVRDARAVLLGPESQSAIYDTTFFRPVRGVFAPDEHDEMRDVAALARAVTHYDRAARWAPFDERIRRERSVVRAAMELRRLDARVAVPPALLAALDPRAIALLTADDPEAALASAEPSSIREAGLLLFLARPGQQGLDLLRAFEARQDPDLLVEGLLGEMYLACGHPALAYPRLRAAYEEYPSSRAQALALAEAAIAVGDHRRAARLLDRAEGLPGADPYDRVARIRALAIGASGRTDEALAAHRHATRPIALSPGPNGTPNPGAPNPVAMTAFGRFLEDAGDVERALATYARIIPSGAAAPAESYVRLLTAWVASWTPDQRRAWLARAIAATPAAGDIDRAWPPSGMRLEPRHMLRILMEARRALPRRIPPVMVTAADEAAHAQRRAEWTESTPASRLAELMRVEDDRFWERLRAADDEDREALLDAWIRGDEAEAARLADRLVASRP